MIIFQYSNHIFKIYFSTSNMGKAVSKDGWITNATEVMPFAGFATAHMHAARENGREAVREVICRVSNSGASVIGL